MAGRLRQHLLERHPPLELSLRLEDLFYEVFTAMDRYDGLVPLAPDASLRKRETAAQTPARAGAAVF
jgi:hypothetical protein